MRTIVSKHYLNFLSVAHLGIVAKKSTKKIVNRTHRSSNLPTLQQFMETVYQEELNNFHESGEQLQIGDAVIARMRGYMPWPGRVQSLNNKIITCYFFGTNNIGPVGAKNVMPYSFAKETVRLVCLRSPNKYIRGIMEIEAVCGVPEELSYLNEIDRNSIK